MGMIVELIKSIELAAKRYRQGREYAQQENAHLAGQWPEPVVPGGISDDPHFEDGYNDYCDEVDRDSNVCPDS